MAVILSQKWSIYSSQPVSSGIPLYANKNIDVITLWKVTSQYQCLPDDSIKPGPPLQANGCAQFSIYLFPSLYERLEWGFKYCVQSQTKGLSVKAAFLWSGLSTKPLSHGEPWTRESLLPYVSWELIRQQTHFRTTQTPSSTHCLSSRRPPAEGNTNFGLENGINGTFQHSGSFHWNCQFLVLVFNSKLIDPRCWSVRTCTSLHTECWAPWGLIDANRSKRQQDWVSSESKYTDLHFFPETGNISLCCFRHILGSHMLPQSQRASTRTIWWSPNPIKSGCCLIKQKQCMSISEQSRSESRAKSGIVSRWGPRTAWPAVSGRPSRGRPCSHSHGPR